ncbi:hypothetical protein [Streptomyces nigrescens]
MTAKTMHQAEANIRAALTALADRYQQIADRATTDVGRLRAMQIRQAATDIRHTLATGRIPAYLMTGPELDALTTAEHAELVDEPAAQ